MALQGNRGVFGHTQAVGSATSTAFTIVPKGIDSSFILHKLKINAAGVSADTAYYGYDGTSGTASTLFIGGAGSTIGSAVPNAALPTDGICFQNEVINKASTVIGTGSISFNVLNNTLNSKKIYIYGEYSY
jgi:hypothetical protein